MRNSLRLAYRDHDRTPLLYVIRDQAARFEQLDIELLHVPGGKEYRGGFLNGDFDLICEHLRFLFPARLEGHPVRCLAATEIQAVDRIVAARSIARATELAGKRIAVRDQESSRLTLKYWLKALGVADGATVEVFPDAEIGRWEQWRAVIDGRADAAFCSPLYLQASLAAGLRVADLPPLPVIGPLFFATREPVIRQKEAAMRAFIRALYRGVHAFRHDPDYAMSIMSQEPATLMDIGERAALETQYNVLRDRMAEKPIPSAECILNTFHMVQEAYDVAALNPLEMWDLRYVIELEEMRFMESLLDKPRRS